MPRGDPLIGWLTSPVAPPDVAERGSLPAGRWTKGRAESQVLSAGHQTRQNISISNLEDDEIDQFQSPKPSQKMEFFAI